MEEQPKKKKRRDYLSNYQKGENGKYAYKGTVYTYQSKGKAFRTELLTFWGFCFGILACLMIIGCMTAPGMSNCFYVIMPYVCTLMSGISVCWALCRLSAAGETLKSYIYEATIEALPMRTALVVIGAVISLIGEIVYVCKNGVGEQLFSFLVFLILNLIIIILSILIHKKANKMVWNK